MEVYAVRLSEVREARGLTQRALADRSGVSPTTINEIETGKRAPRQSTKRKLAKALQANDWDLGADQEKMPHSRLRVVRVREATGKEYIDTKDVNMTIQVLEAEKGVVVDIRFLVIGEDNDVVDAWIIYDDQGETK